jgi:hypothetical protein
MVAHGLLPRPASLADLFDPTYLPREEWSQL